MNCAHRRGTGSARFSSRGHRVPDVALPLAAEVSALLPRFLGYNCSRLNNVPSALPSGASFFVLFHKLLGHSLGGCHSGDVLLFAQKAVTFRTRDEDMANAGKSANQPATDVPPDLHDRNAQINGGFFDLECTSIAKCNSFCPRLEFFLCQRLCRALPSSCIGSHNVTTNTPTYSFKTSPFFFVSGVSLEPCRISGTPSREAHLCGE